MQMRNGHAARSLAFVIHYQQISAKVNEKLHDIISILRDSIEDGWTRQRTQDMLAWGRVEHDMTQSENTEERGMTQWQNSRVFP